MSYRESLYVLECAVLNIQEYASKMGYSLEALDRLKLAYSEMEDIVKQMELLQGTKNRRYFPNNKQRIFFDMDGTLAAWEDNPIEVVSKPGYFYSRKPVLSVINAMRILSKMNDYDVYILSSVFVDDHSVSEKIAWNALYTGLPKAKQLYVPYGQDKDVYLQECGGIRPSDILIDDFSYNLHQWSGTGIKIYNGVNGTNGTWKGPTVNYKEPAEDIVNKIIAVAKEAAKGLSKEEEMKLC